MRGSLSFLVGILVVGSVTGCQSWSQLGTGALQSTSRVPPPGTGSFPVPKGAYNTGNASMGSPAAGGMMASNDVAEGTGVRTASATSAPNWTLPSTSQYRNELAGRANSAISDMQAKADRLESEANRVVQASATTVQAASAIGSEFTDPAPSLRPQGAAPATRSLSDSNPTSSQLNWQAPR